MDKVQVIVRFRDSSVKRAESQISHSGPRVHKTGSKYEQINKSAIRFFARLCDSGINLYLPLPEGPQPILVENSFAAE